MGFTVLLMLVLVFAISDMFILPSHIPCCVSLISLAAINYRIGQRDVFYPGFVFNAVWAFAFCLYTFSFVQINDISLYADFVFVLGGTVFTVSSYLSQRVPTLHFSISPKAPISRTTGKVLLLCYVVLVSPFFYRDIVNLTRGNLSLALIRVALVDSVQTGQSFYTNPFTRVLPLTAVMVTVVWFIGDRGKKRSRLSYAAAILAFLIALLTTGRPQILQLCLALPAVALFVPHKGLSFRKSIGKATPFLIAIPIVLSAITLLTKTTAPSDGSGGEQIGYASSLFVWYITGNMVAFDIFLHHPFPYGTINSFVLTPFPINTYTAYVTPYEIGGLVGIVIFALFIGAFHGYLYKYARKGSDLGLFLYSIFLYQLAMSIFSDQYLSIGVFFYLELLVFGLFYYFFLCRFTFFPASLTNGRKHLPDATPPHKLTIE
jgi:oligosaccharide repeat unit polymerase